MFPEIPAGFSRIPGIVCEKKTRIQNKNNIKIKLLEKECGNKNKTKEKNGHFLSNWIIIDHIIAGGYICFWIHHIDESITLPGLHLLSASI